MRTAPSVLAQSYGTNGFRLEKERRGLFNDVFKGQVSW